MRALLYHAPRDIRYETCADPALLAPTDALVRVEYSAICGSDLHVWHGRETGLDAGTAMGHEFAGEVVELGRDVRTLRRGSRVVSPFTTSCGGCFFCRRGLTARCPRGELFGWVSKGRGLPGGQAEYIRVPLADSTLIRVADTIPLDRALLLGDVLPTGYYCALRADLATGDACAVIGCGAVGLMAVVAAIDLGASRVFALDAIPERRALAARFGAEPIDPASDEAVGAIRDATDGRGVDSALEVVGSAAATRLAVSLLRPGGTLSAVGVHHEPALAVSAAEFYDLNLTYRAGRCPARALADRVAPLLVSSRFDLGAVLTHRLPLAGGSAAYDLFAARRAGCIKVVLTP